MNGTALKTKKTAAAEDLRRYGDAIRLWLAKFDTWSIAQRLGVAECQVERWVWNFREMTRGAP
jgi:hypothetical protein